MSEFRHVDTRRPDGCYVQFVRVIKRDDATTPDDKSETRKRVAAWMRDEWHYVGILARANCMIVKDGVGTYVSFESAGLWGIESDSDDSYLEQVFREEVSDLKDIIAAFAAPTYEDDPTAAASPAI